MKNKKKLLRLSYLLKTSAETFLVFAIITACFTIVEIAKAFLRNDINIIIYVVTLAIAATFIFYVFYAILRGIRELIMAVINIVESVEGGNSKDVSKYFTT